MENEMQVTYTKLKRENEWGVKVRNGNVKPGDTVTVTLKNGQTRQEKIRDIVARFDDAILCTLDRDGGGDDSHF